MMPVRLPAAALADPLTRSPAHAAVQVGRPRMDHVAHGTLLAYDGEVPGVEGRVTLEKLPEALTVYRPIAGY
jgi:undecaprenyl-diphosphatase